MPRSACNAKDIFPLITLVTGRSVSACMRAYDLLKKAAAGPSTFLPPAVSFEQQPPIAKPKKKRAAPGEGPSAPADPTLQAQPFTTVNPPGNASIYQPAPTPLQPTAGEQTQKKRGRPNKEEHERRVREAAQRGEVYPPPKKIKTARQSLESAAEGGAMLDKTEDGSTSQKTAKKPQLSLEMAHLPPELPARTSSLEASTIGATDQMHTRTEELMKSTIPEPQTSDSLARESLLAGMQEHAAMATQAEQDTMEVESTPNQESGERDKQ